MQEQKYDFPTEVIDLPSQGLCYPEGHPLSKGQITLKYMTAKEEDILSSQNLIKKGIVLDKLLESVVVDISIDDLVLGDKNAIFLATRILGYGPIYKVQVTDPFSGEKQEVDIDLGQVKTKEIDYSKLKRDNKYDFALPSDGTKIKFRFLTHKDEQNITSEIQALDKLSKGANPSDVTTRLRHMILEVNGNTDRAFINKWVNTSFKAQDSRALRNYVKEISPDLELKFEFTSDITGETEALDIPFGINFFTLPTNYSAQLHEELWSMVQFGNGFTWRDVYTMPIHWRRFYLKKLVELKKKEKEEMDKAKRSRPPGASKVRMR